MQRLAGMRPDDRDNKAATGTPHEKGPAWRGLFNPLTAGPRPALDQPTLGSLNASISPLNASTGTQLQNTFLSP